MKESCCYNEVCFSLRHKDFNYSVHKSAAEMLIIWRESFFIGLKACSSVHKRLSAFYLTEVSNGQCCYSVSTI